jgi:alcohol dehydrogenase (cytochrome c)
LWHFETGSALYASPMTYSLNGRQYVAIASGQALISFALPQRVFEKERSGR